MTCFNTTGSIPDFIAFALLFIVFSYVYLLSQVVSHTKLSDTLCPARPNLISIPL